MVGRYSVALALILLIVQLEGISSALPPRVPAVELQDVLDHKYSPQYFNGTWISDDSLKYYHNSWLFVYNVTSRDRVMMSDISTTLELGDFEIVSSSSDGQYALLYNSKQRIYRHSFEAQYKVLHLESKVVLDVLGGDLLQLVEWSPVGHNLVYVKDNDIYYVNESFQATDALTRDGVAGIVFNGVADWVYEEEVLSNSKALWFSSDGKILAYMKFNDRQVHDMSYIRYGKPGNKKAQYPEVVTLKYPKAGTFNPIVELHVLAIDHGIDFDVIFDKSLTFSGEALITDVSWTKQDNLLVTLTNRVQNVSNSFLCKLTILDSRSDCKLILENSEDNGWVELASPVVSKNEASFLYILPLVQQDFKSYPQLLLHRSGDSEDLPLTKGQISVTDILAWDEEKQVVFYQAVRASYRSESHVYMVQIQSGQTFCLSCDAQKPCSFASASFSKDFTYYALTCKGPGVPFVRIHYTYAAYQKAIQTWEDNAHLLYGLEDLSLPSYENINVALPDDHEALVRLVLPKQMDRSGRLKYPLLLNVYGGPGSNIITDRFSINFHTYLVSNQHAIVVYIDARGSAYRSKEQEFTVYRNLGVYEIEDQISIVKYLTAKYQFIDKKRIGIWGWSYGGFATAMVLARDKDDIFRCGVAVAPVTNFLNYDSIYTERYMGLPSDNDAGYNWTDVTNKVDNFAHKKFLLMHGSADDNVHYQQSMMLTEALEAKDILFDQQTYPDQSHSISSYQHHVYHTINHFFTDCFKPHAEDNIV